MLIFGAGAVDATVTGMGAEAHLSILGALAIAGVFRAVGDRGSFENFFGIDMKTAPDAEHAKTQRSQRKQESSSSQALCASAFSALKAFANLMNNRLISAGSSTPRRRASTRSPGR